MHHILYNELGIFETNLLICEEDCLDQVINPPIFNAKGWGIKSYTMQDLPPFMLQDFSLIYGLHDFLGPKLINQRMMN